MDAPLEEEPRAGAAHLARVRDEGPERPGHRLLEVRVGEDEVGRLPAELEREWQDAVGGEVRDLPAGPEGAREGDLPDAAVRDDRRARLRSRPRHDVEGAGGKPALDRELRQLEETRGGELGGLRHHDVARREGWSGGARSLIDGGVPGQDDAHHPEWLAPRVGVVAGAEVDRLAP